MRKWLNMCVYFICCTWIVTEAECVNLAKYFLNPLFEGVFLNNKQVSSGLYFRRFLLLEVGTQRPCSTNPQALPLTFDEAEWRIKQYGHHQI